MIYIFIVETSKANKSDEMYISKVLKELYFCGSNKVQYVYMNGKTNYNQHTVLSKTNTWINKYQGDSEVFMCIDIDNPSKHINNDSLNNEIINYCIEMNYHLIWFNEDIEEVFLGKKVCNSEKKEFAKRFYSYPLNPNLLLKSISSACSYPKLPKKSSNILFVLDQYIPRK